MKKTSIILFLLLSISLMAAEPDLKKNFRGISFFPKTQQKVKNISINIPSSCNRSDQIHKQDKYPVTAFMANCSDPESCFTLLIIISVIPDKINSYENLISKAKKSDFSSEPFEADEWTKDDKSQADKMTILFGRGLISGNATAGFYYDKANKETYVISVKLIYNEQFNDEDWKSIVLNTYLLYNSVVLNK
ncbi:MAG: hypothetical protein JW982_05995 [Spirochaetes bacterium]|nr:hypothetical protein [Spirochaetota bacterium]